MARDTHRASDFAGLAEAYVQVAREVHKRGDALLNYFLEMAEIELIAALARDAATAHENSSSMQVNQSDEGRAGDSSRLL